MSGISSLEDHPVWKTIVGFDLKEKTQSRLAFKVYMDITEVKGWWNVRVHLCEDLRLVFLSGHASCCKPREIILPLSASSSCSPAQLKRYIHSCRVPDLQTNALVLGLSSPDSNTVYYRISDGLVPPDPPDVTEWKKYRSEELPQLRRHHVGEQTAAYIRRLEQQQQYHQQQQETADVEDGTHS